MKNQKGFTIIELLIASVAFTVILVLVTTIVIQVSKIYYKGVVLSNTQNVDSTIIQDVSKDIQFGSNSSNLQISKKIAGNIEIYCIGDNVFIFNPGQEFVSPGTNIGLLYGSSLPCSSISPTKIDVINYINNYGFHELLNPMMRVINFSINNNLPNGLLYGINIGIAFGSDQSLCNTSVASSCINSDVMSTSGNYKNYFGSNIQCKLQQGDQYCGTSYLNTVVANEYNLN